MIVVDTSAVVAVLLGEDGGHAIEHRLLAEPCAMSAATRVELGIVVEARSGPAGTQLLEELLARVGVDVIAVDAQQAASALVCWRRFGKGRHPAGLNFGDTFPTHSPSSWGLRCCSSARTSQQPTSRLPESAAKPRGRVAFKQRRRCRSGRGEFGHGGDLALGFVVVVSAFDADEEFLVQDRQDALEYRDGRDVVSAFELGDERV